MPRPKISAGGPPAHGPSHEPLQQGYLGNGLPGQAITVFDGLQTNHDLKLSITRRMDRAFWPLTPTHFHFDCIAIDVRISTQDGTSSEARQAIRG